MLAELAKLFSANDHETLAMSLHVVALQAAMEDSPASATDKSPVPDITGPSGRKWARLARESSTGAA
jgi:hypothetical protein